MKCLYLGSVEGFPFLVLGFLADVGVNLNPLLSEVSAAVLALD